MQAYSNPERASDPHALPDLEVFYVGDPAIRTERNRLDYLWTDDFGRGTINGGDPVDGPGWYYWYCFPGCLPDSEPFGPFASKAEALADAQSNDLGVEE